jgi:hypothetical protein
MQTVAFRIMGPEMYKGMSALGEPSPVIERGIAIHKVHIAKIVDGVRVRCLAVLSSPNAIP